MQLHAAFGPLALVHYANASNAIHTFVPAATFSAPHSTDKIN
jgi:hypothetical protein